jgi:hypothetical protein
MRHSNIAVTSIYVHSNPETVRIKTKDLWNDLLAYDTVPLVDREAMLVIQHNLILWLVRTEVYNM